MSFLEEVFAKKPKWNTLIDNVLEGGSNAWENDVDELVFFKGEKKDDRKTTELLYVNFGISKRGFMRLDATVNSPSGTVIVSDMVSLHLGINDMVAGKVQSQPVKACLRWSVGVDDERMCYIFFFESHVLFVSVQLLNSPPSNADKKMWTLPIKVDKRLLIHSYKYNDAAKMMPGMKKYNDAAKMMPGMKKYNDAAKMMHAMKKAFLIGNKDKPSWVILKQQGEHENKFHLAQTTVLSHKELEETFKKLCTVEASCAKCGGLIVVKKV